MPTMERSCSSNSTIIQRGRSLYVEARLQGGAPWGFTLKGGLEHRELLIISKVEEGGKADLLDHPLLPGDQVVIINDVELTGFRQEAISLVKGSYKTLRLTVRRECCPTPYSADPRPQSASSNHESCCSEPRPSSAASSNHGASRDSRGCSGGVKLRIKNRRSEPASRPHSWHSTKLGDPQQEPSMMQISQGTMGVPWHQTYHSSASTTDLSSYEAGYLRKSPDQYSSRGSMESLDPPHPAYSSCHQLSASKSSNSIDHLHSKRDSAYSSFSTSSSIPEYLAAAPSFSKERSYSMENVPQQKTVEGMQQADIRYVRTIYDPQQGVSEEHEVTSAALMRGGESRSQSRSGSVQGGACHRGSSSSSGSSGSSCGGFSASQRHSVGPVWVQAQNRNSYENLKGAPAPPLRSDSFAAIRNHERPNSWSSLEQARSVRALQKGSWHHSSGSVATGKSSFGIDGQLHTVIEKSPESSPTTKPKQGFPQASQPGRPMLPTGVYPVPLPEPHFAQVPTTCPSSSSVYPALAKESKQAPQREQGEGKRSGDVKMAVENGYQSNASCTTSVQPQGPAQSKQTQQGQGEPQTKCGLYRPHLQAQGHKTSTPSIVQERRDPYTPTHARGEKSRHPHASEGTDSQSPYSDQVFHSEPVHATAKVPQGQVPNPRGSASPRHHSDSSAYQQRDWGMDHPLTRLENALAEVQMSVGPENTAGQSSHKKERSMSVLEKVSRFERRDQTKPRGQSTLSNHNSSFRANQGSHGTKSSLSSVEDLRNMLERSNSFILQGRTHTASHEGRMEKQPEVRQRRMSTGQAQHGYAPDPATILQRSKSTFQLSEENGNDFHWKNDLRDILGPFQDTSYNRSYRDSIKDAQSKVLRSTSFRRRDLSVHPPLMPSKNMTLERKTPMTTPKPATTSPHTPKERHVVPVEVADRISPPELPSAPAVGPPVTRIGGRKRLTMEQKKRSYSEPENMHEVGISDAETSLSPRKISQQFLFPETSVADRRRMFELAAGRNTGRKPRPDLKQQQQDALAEYMERKTGRKVEGRSHRPHSAYLQSGSSSTESWSLSSTPSMTSLQEPDSESIPGFNRQPPNLLMGPQSSIHPSRSHSAQAQFEAYPPTHRPQGRAPQPQRPDREPNKPIPALTLCPASEDPRSQTLFRNRDATFERAAPARKSGKSASAEDLLDHTEDRPAAQHFRSRSSPAVENFNQDFLPVDLQSLGMVSGEPYPSTHRENRYQLNPGPGQQNVPVIRRERQKHSERQRAQSTSSLAASVGLPCPLTSPGTGAAPPDWQASERLCQANLDAIAFPCPPQGGAQVNVEAHRRTMGQSSYPSPSTSEEPAQDAPKDTPQQHPPAAQAPPVAPKSAAPPSPTHQEAHAAPLGDPAPRRGHTGPPTLPKIRTSPPKSLPSLRISESALALTPPPSVSQYEDDVFLAPPSPPPPSLPIRETDITEDLPLPPPPICVLSQEEEAGPVDSPPSSFSSVSHASEDTMASRPPSDPSHLPGTPDPEMTPLRVSESSAAESEPRSPPPAASDEEEDEEAQAAESQEAEETERWLLSRREAEAAGQRVEALTRELVARDKSLAPLLDTWAGSRSTLDLMEEIFPTARSLQERQGGSSADSEQEDRTKDVVSISGDVKSPSISRGMETDLDQLEADLNQKKVELLQVLSSSVAVLRGERESLAEEQKRYSALGASVEALVQERCKPNESDKYRTFIGDLERIVNLLLSLSGRLARVEIALAALEGDEGEASTEERELLLQKRRQLRSQREDARELKENLDRRQRVVLDILRGYLSPAQLRDHRRHARAKPALLVRQRHLDELIKQGEEQLQRLGEDLPPERRPQIPGQAPPSPRPTTVTSL